ncbi:MAG: hypothetical protein R2762_16030 [Bryobacteraceae bacterium]
MNKTAAILFLATVASAAQFPEAQISNGAITARFYLPDAENGYYRGTRFDWSGVIYSLKTAKHEYFGQWFPKYDPKLHDAIMGPVEEFRTDNAGLGYDEAKPGGTFIRIGVGVVKKPDEPQYQGFRTYDIVDHGQWRVRPGKNRIEFQHDLRDGTGYAYRYTKRIRLEPGRPVMVIEHELKNTGRKPIVTSQYNHNFFVIDGKPTGPATHVKVPFPLDPVRAFRDDIAVAEGSRIRYNRELETGQSVFGEFRGFGPGADAYDIRVENSEAHAGVHITGDRPLSKFVYWSIRTVFSPEPYIDLSVDPGKSTGWTYRYEFLDLP